VVGSRNDDAIRQEPNADKHEWYGEADGVHDIHADTPSQNLLDLAAHFQRLGLGAEPPLEPGSALGVAVV